MLLPRAKRCFQKRRLLVLALAGCALLRPDESFAQSATETSGLAVVEILSLRYGDKDYKSQLESGADSVAPMDGDSVRLHRYKALGLPEQRGQLSISFGTKSSTGKFAVRLQYKLEGHDSDWRDLDKGSMHLVLKFLDSNRIPISRTEIRLNGDSVGWNDRLDVSELSTRVEEAIVPPRASFVSIWIDSGGHDENAGVWLVDDLRISDVSGGTGAGPLLLEENFENGTDLAQAQGDFDIWVRDGGAIEGAMVHRGNPSKGEHALLLVDSNPLDYSAWRLKDRNLLPVSPGQKLRLEWKEVYSLGWGRGGEAVYSDLPSGHYQFRVREVDAYGRPKGEEAVLPIVVAPPFYANLWFRAAAGATFLVLILGVERLFSRARNRRRLEDLQRKQALEEERARIARDIHDDLGTVLSRISMASESVALEAESGSSQQKRLKEICEASRDLTRTMEQIVWAQNPVHDSIDNTASFFASFATELLGAAGVACRLDIPIDLPPHALEADKRHELFLVFKEALNNIIKHSGATVVRISLRLKEARLVLVVEDNGCGFDATAARGASRGNGLHNMRNRIRKVGGEVSIVSSSGKGTRIEFSVPCESSKVGDLIR